MKEVRQFLKALAPGRQQRGRLPEALRRLAWQAVGCGQPPDLADDALAEFLVKLVEATRRRSPGGAQNLLDLGDGSLAAVLRFRIRQAAMSLYVEWPLVKSLRAHVKAALDRGELPAGVDLPLTLLRHDHLAADLVRQACAAVLARKYPPPRTVAEVADALLELYFTPAPGGEVDAAADYVDDDVETVHDAHVYAAQTRQLLGTEVARALGERAAGKSLREIGKRNRGQAASTLHAKLTQAQHRLRDAFAAEAIPHPTACLVMELLAGGSGSEGGR